jgi:hypothetical protein
MAARLFTRRRDEIRLYVGLYILIAVGLTFVALVRSGVL